MDTPATAGWMRMSRQWSREGDTIGAFVFVGGARRKPHILPSSPLCTPCIEREVRIRYRGRVALGK
ncbi:unnamed protein product [Periconia digitata]|uniref:Uncharacterized protein n=1 Tax=Periconia digitata TaxID=1303443 RepID=A0A9W4UQJ2_9PLEO|nr:unnamed protein product [Periconia digitata]